MDLSDLKFVGVHEHGFVGKRKCPLCKTEIEPHSPKDLCYKNKPICRKCGEDFFELLKNRNRKNLEEVLESIALHDRLAKII